MSKFLFHRAVIVISSFLTDVTHPVRGGPNAVQPKPSQLILDEAALSLARRA